ncbi:MAG: hypothetical protein WBV23_06880 [Desulfobaccales bacterium]
MAEQNSTISTDKKCILSLEKRVMALVVVLLLLPAVSHALTDEQKALVGLKGVHVLVENLKPEIERLGLIRDQIQTDVEMRLRKAGARVLTEKESQGTPGMPYLYVNVNAVTKPGSTFCAYSIKVQLKKKVAIESGFKIPGVVWHTTGYAGTCKITNITQIRNLVGDQVDQFINDYLAANPK